MGKRSNISGQIVVPGSVGGSACGRFRWMKARRKQLVVPVLGPGGCEVWIDEDLKPGEWRLEW